MLAATQTVVTSSSDVTIVVASTVTGACAILASGVAGWFSYRGMKEARAANHAVNGAPAGDPTLRESVNEMKADMSVLKDGQVVLQEGQATIHHRSERIETNLDAYRAETTTALQQVGGEVSGIARRQVVLADALQEHITGADHPAP